MSTTIASALLVTSSITYWGFLLNTTGVPIAEHEIRDKLFVLEASRRRTPCCNLHRHGFWQSGTCSVDRIDAGVNL